MPRNIDRRVEVLFPVSDPTLKKEILENILEVYLRDTEKSYVLQPDGSYERLQTRRDESMNPFGSQEWFLNGRVTLQHQIDVKTP
jgi:polyphosphate kinase